MVWLFTGIRSALAVSPTNQPFLFEERIDGVDEEWVRLLGTVTVVELDNFVE